MRLHKIMMLVLVLMVVMGGFQAMAEDDLFEMEEVVVTASRYPEELRETPVSMEVIDQEEIGNSSAGNVAELLQGVGGLTIKDEGGSSGRKSLIIRGIRADSILVLIDGQPMNNPQDGQVYLEQIPVEFIKRIEISKSPASAVYGPNAMGGVVNIITRDAQDVDRTSLDLAYGSFSTQDIGFSHSFQKGDHALTLIADQTKSEGHRDHSSLDRDNIFTKYQYDLNKSTDLTFTYKYNDSEADYPGSENIPGTEGTREDNSRDFSFKLNQNYEQLDREFILFQNDHELNDITNDSITDINKQGLIFRQTHYSKRHEVNYGFELNKNGVDKKTGGSTDYDEENLNQAVFVQDKIDINKSNTLNLGLRYDNHEEYGSELSPRLGLIHSINENLDFKTTAGKSYRAPNFMELYQDSPLFGYYSNTELDPELVYSYEMGLIYRNNNCKREFNIFKRDINDLIQNKLLDNGDYKLFNLAESTITGAEFNIDRQLTDSLNISFKYTYLDAVDDETDEQLVDIPHNQADISLSHQYEKGSFKVSGNYLGERQDVSGKDMPSHFVADMRLTRELSSSKELIFSVNNLFDREYQVVDGYPMPERNYTVELSLDF